jgi:hypothetical protein
MMLFHPQCCHTSEITYTDTNVELPRKLTPVTPKNSATRVIRPDEGDRNTCSMPTITTIEMKCGRYVAVCRNFLRVRPTTWLTISASAIGATKPATSVVRLITTVLRISVQNCGLSKNCWKYLRPTNSPPVSPAEQSNSRNASWSPYIGT